MSIIDRVLTNHFFYYKNTSQIFHFSLRISITIYFSAKSQKHLSKIALTRITVGAAEFARKQTRFG